MISRTLFLALLCCLFFLFPAGAEEPISISGVYPHLTMRNQSGECGTGAIVPWQGSLWAVTYSPHSPNGSTDKLYEVTPELAQKIFEGSVGGTPANRMIHPETNQLLIGPYVIDAKKEIRVLPPSKMFGRLTANARHLTDPQAKVYYATMEEGLYEVDLKTLDVKCLIKDGHEAAPDQGVKTKLPGYHGKGLYSSQGRLVYANNGEVHKNVKTDPTIASGALAQWFGEGDWQMVRRNQFTEVTGPGGIQGNAKPETDPIWSMGWDARSLILALLENKEWHYFRLPKGSHSYDGSHGWNTEWPRIREIGEKSLLATMHGTFWRFPAGFSLANSSGIAPRSNYLKVIGDFCRWNDRLVLGCDDSAQAEFFNTRTFKSEHGAPKQSNSNLWFIQPETLDDLGPVIGRGSVWLRENVDAQSVSDPYLFSGYDHRQLHLIHDSSESVEISMEVDREGNNTWEEFRRISVPAKDGLSVIFSEEESGVWIRLKSLQKVEGVTANFQYRNRDERENQNDSIFDGIAKKRESENSYGLMRSLAFDRLGIVASSGPDAQDATYYELNPKMELVPVDDPKAAADLVGSVRQPEGTYTVDEASVLVIEDGKRYRLPKSETFVNTAIEKTQSDRKSLEDYLGESLSKGAAVKVSSTHSDFDGSKAVDGSIGESDRWIAKNDGETWIELDLGSEKTIGSIWVVSGWKKEVSFVARDFEVQTKIEGEWQTVSGGNIQGNSSIKREIVLDAPVNAQHVRLVTSSNEFFRIYELALFDRKLEIDESGMSGFGVVRVCREVATERDLLNLHGTFYELPARNAQGIAKIRPVSTHKLQIHDFCSHAGLLLFTGLNADAEGDHIFRSEDGRAAVWAGVVDDLWKMGKPRGTGGPWKDSHVAANVPSDPYLMTAYDRKKVTVSSSEAASITLEVDVDGTGVWIPCKNFSIEAGGEEEFIFPEGFSAYWVRAISDVNTVATATFVYE